ncbi:DUF4830 domain-containing protein [Paenibacillus sp. CMAA1364]
MIILPGCAEKEKGIESLENYNKQHVTYLKEYGWSIKRFTSETKYAAETLRSYEEHVNTIRSQGKVDLTPFLDKEVLETGYILNEKTDHYNQIVGYILESGEEIIGSYLEFNHEIEQKDGIIRIDIGVTTPIFKYNEINEQSIVGHKVNHNNNK